MTRPVILFCLFALFLIQAVTSSPSYSLEEVRKIVKQHSLESRAFVNLGGRRYYFPPSVPITAIDAITICSDLGMTLAGLETKAENDLVKNHIHTQETAFGYWTSGNRYFNKWMWTNSGQLFAFTDWEFNEPNEPSDVDACVMIHGATAWSDSKCDATALYVCEQIG